MIRAVVAFACLREVVPALVTFAYLRRLRRQMPELFDGAAALAAIDRAILDSLEP